jgi:uncharacterized membrane protein YtjA (UPF0391 family)
MPLPSTDVSLPQQKGQSGADLKKTIGVEFMLKWAAIFFVIALIAAVLGFTGIAGAAAQVAQFLFFLFVAICFIVLVLAVFTGSKLG